MTTAHTFDLRAAASLARVLLAVGCISAALAGCSDDPAPAGTKDAASAADAANDPDGQALDVEASDCPEGEPCDDGKPCTTDDKCNASEVCDGTAKTGGDCDDGSECSEKDACKDGTCVGVAVACNDEDPCTKDACVPETGCEFSKQTGIDCDDGDACTTGDKCFDGKCDPGEDVKVCADGGACVVVSCDKKTGECVSANGNEAADCDPGSKCIEAAKCKAGLCAGTAKECDDGNPCTADTCNATDGVCDYDDLAMDDKPCDDEDDCTIDDACTGGKCEKSSPKLCDDSIECTKDSCIKDGKCLFDPQSGATCDDNNPCTEGDVCNGVGKCGGTDKCDCKKDADCPDDGNLCTGILKCDLAAATCKLDAATVVTCAPSTAVCTVNACDAKTGKCALANSKEGSACDDGSKCSTADNCLGGKCGGTAVKCGDGKPCTGVTCDPAKGCVTEKAKDGDACDADGDACTAGDQCQGGACTKGKAKTCDDKNPCTVDSCNPKTGACETSSDQTTDGSACDADGSVCTVSDSCAGGKCIAGKPKTCNDNEICTDNICDAKNGCNFSANAAPCDDGNKCTSGDLCSGAKCAAGKAVTCDDGDKCTTDKCDSSKGCTYTAIGGCNSTNKTWTVLLYLAADNNLESAAIADLNEMMKISDADHLKFVVQLDRSDAYSTSAIGGVSNFNTAKRLLVNKGKVTELKDLGELNTGDPKHLEEFIAWGLTTYPADRTMLVLWNHGHAWQGFGGDDSSSNNDALTLAEMSSAIKAGLAGAKVSKFDMVGFDACLMASLTTAEVMKPYTTYLLASEDLVPGNGWDYFSFDTVAKTPNQPVADVGKAIIDGFKAQSSDLKKDTSITLALMDLSQLDPVSTAVKALASALGSNLTDLATKLGQSRDRVQEFGRSDNPDDAYFQIDIGDLSEQMADLDATLSTKKDDLLKALANLVIYQVNGVVTAEATGIALYFPPLEKHYLDKFEQLTGIESWAKTVTDFYGEADKIDYQPTFEHGTAEGGQQGSGPVFKPIGISGHNLSTGGNGTGKEELSLPYVETFGCSSSTADKWKFPKVDEAIKTKSAAKWAVDLTPTGVGNSCTLNFNMGIGSYLCLPASGGKLTDPYISAAWTPWLNVTDLKLLYVGVVMAPNSSWPVDDSLEIDITQDEKTWTPIHYLFGSESQSATLDLTKVYPAGAKRVKLRLRFTIGDCDLKLPKVTVNGKTKVALGPAIERFVVYSPANACAKLKKGAWCAGEQLVTCLNGNLLDTKVRCEFGCDSNGGTGSAACKGKTYGSAGEVAVTCDKNGILKLSAKVDSATIKNVARAHLRFGYNSPQDYGLQGVKADNGQKTSYPQFFGSVKADVAKDGSITASWDQNVLVARHPKGNTILFTKRTITKNVDHHEVPINYVDNKVSKCPCTKPNDKAYKDIDGDKVADCVDFDADGDGILNVADNCPWIKNEDQAINANGVPAKCPKGADTGKPAYACNPEPADSGFPGVWHVDLHLNTGALISQTIYVKRPYGISAIEPDKDGQILAQSMRRTGVEKPAFLFTALTNYPNPAIPAFLSDSKDLVLDTMPLSQVPFLIDKSQVNLPQFQSICATFKPYGTAMRYCSYPLGTPYSIADARNLTDLWLQLIIEDIGGRGDSVIYRGPVPDNCLPKLSTCPVAGESRDCLGNCVNIAKYKGNGVCDHGKKLGVHLRCERHKWDGGDCSDCEEEGMLRDCQGNCHAAKAIDRMLGNGICNDGSQDIDPPVAGRVQGPDLRCATYSFDEGDCEAGKHDEPGQCQKMTEVADCDGQCISDVEMAVAPPGNTTTCRSRFRCERFGFDGGKCKASGQTSCPAGCPYTKCVDNVCLPWFQAACPSNCSGHGKCVDGKCDCDSAWQGPACNVPLPTDTCCVPGKNAGCSDSWVQACVCQRKPACCTGTWNANCVTAAEKWCKPQCGAEKICPEKYCGNAVDDANNYLAVGRRHACAIGKKGTVRCWGDGAGGKLGTLDTKSRRRPTLIPQLAGMVTIDAGNNHTCGIRKGAVFCWGCNAAGQIGDGTLTDRKQPKKLSLTNVTQLAASEDHTCAVSDAKLYCWGSNSRGQTGDTKSGKVVKTPKVVAGAQGVKKLATGGAHTCAIVANGDTLCFGDQSKAQTGLGTTSTANVAKPTKVPGAEKATAICAGIEHTCIIKSDKTVWCWGGNKWSQGGKNSPNVLTKPTQVGGLTPASSIACGHRHTCIINGAKKVKCWGNNSHGQAGHYVFAQSGNPFNVLDGVTTSNPPDNALGDIAQIDAGWLNTCALDTGGELYCWGDNTWAQMGNGKTGHRECEPACMGKTCGFDGCGGTCGVCPSGAACHANQCLSCLPNCKGRNCGSDGCGGTCGNPKLYGSCDSGKICDHESGVCTVAKNCKGKCNEWLHGSTGLPVCYCGAAGKQIGKACSDTDTYCKICTPQCTGKACGDDGCGGSCGACEGGKQCNTVTFQCQSPCVSTCGTRTCGDDGCLNECGTCKPGQICSKAGACVVPACTPKCDGRTCGIDGCGGFCGTNGGGCPNGGACDFPTGTCPCNPKCTSPQTCVSGTCQLPYVGCKSRCGKSSYEPDGKTCRCDGACTLPGPGKQPPFCCQDKKAMCG